MEDEDFYFEGNLMVFTREFHLKRGECCGSGCRHCPYDPRWTKGTTTVEDKEREMTRLPTLPPEGGTTNKP
ncbi:MAG: DUF5522 domain-containing protein [Blastocatellia bacterium]